MAGFGYKFKKNIKIFAEIFGGLKIMRTFAARLRENGLKSSLKRLKESTRSKYRENTIYREALILLKELEVSVTSWKFYKRLYNEEFDPGSG